ncbi:aminopeptidase N [Granulicoccus phenolivorans]|uniref:aminopeptidase N n=1 Tax=Granulicoccus phenolivorans TaxID=266854 RepID=UPI0004016A71|nr:aminopeptidase N [Granulicoccus phenolivorans]
MGSLQRVEAERRSAQLGPVAAHVELDLTGAADPSRADFVSRTRLEFTALPGTDTFADLHCVELGAAVLNGKALPADAWADGRLRLSDLREANVLTATATMRYHSDGEGLHRHTDPADGLTYLYAMSFLDAAPDWFACFDQPDLKVGYSFDVRVPPGWTVLGNGRFVEVELGHWRTPDPTGPIPTYAVTLIAGPYASITDRCTPTIGAPIPLGIHARQSLADALDAEAADILAVTRAGFTAFTELFGVEYPFGEYHQVFVPDFNAGAMENPGCVTFRDQLLFEGRATHAERASRAGTICHEMAHQWFGDLVTPRWWDDLWLNESFAEFLGHQVCSEYTDYDLWTEFGIRRKWWGLVADLGPATHPVAGNGAADARAALAAFDGISYAKGAAALRQLLAALGPDVFWGGLAAHIRDHAWGSATLADLVDAWIAAGAVGLPEWVDAWLRTSGFDTLAVRAGHLHRTGTGVRRPHRVTVAALAPSGAVTGTRSVHITADDTPLDPALATGGLVVPDADDRTWARLDLGDPAGWPPISAVAQPATRVSLWNSLRLGVHEGAVDPEVALGLICRQLPAEPAVAAGSAQLWSPLAEYARGQLIGTFLAPDRRTAALTDLAAALAPIAAHPDPQVRVPADRLIAGCTTDPELLARFAAAEDTPLSWTALIRISALTGDLAPAEAAYAKHPTATPRIRLAEARAAQRTPEAKQRAFELLIRPGETSAYELYATASGLFHPEQTDLTRPWVERYFAEINTAAEFLHGWSLREVVSLAFPAGHTDAPTLALAEQTLRTADLDPQVRTCLEIGTDLLRRGVRARRRFGAGSTEPKGVA